MWENLPLCCRILFLTWFCIFHTICCLLNSDEDLATDGLSPLLLFRHTKVVLRGFGFLQTHAALCSRRPLLEAGRPTYAGPVTVDMLPQVAFHADRDSTCVSQTTHTHTIPHCLAQSHKM